MARDGRRECKRGGAIAALQSEPGFFGSSRGAGGKPHGILWLGKEERQRRFSRQAARAKLSLLLLLQQVLARKLHLGSAAVGSGRGEEDGTAAGRQVPSAPPLPLAARLLRRMRLCRRLKDLQGETRFPSGIQAPGGGDATMRLRGACQSGDFSSCLGARGSHACGRRAG